MCPAADSHRASGSQAGPEGDQGPRVQQVATYFGHISQLLCPEREGFVLLW